MKPIRSLASVLAAIALLAAAAATTASAAEPIFERVVITPVKEGEKIPFTSTSGKSTLETVEKAKIVCSSASEKGFIVGPSGITVSVAFKGCESSASKCTSTGALEGEVITNVFEGKLGNIKSNSTPGIALFQPKDKTTDAEFTCGATKVKLTGGVVGPIGPIGKVVNKLTLTYQAKAGVQLFESLFGGPLDTLSIQFAEGKPEQSGLTAKVTVTLSEPLQIT
jgi:hypothetical protein